MLEKDRKAATGNQIASVLHSSEPYVPRQTPVRQRSRQDKVHARCSCAVALSLALDGSLSHVFTTLAAGLLCRNQEKHMRYSKVLAFTIMLAALTSIPSSAPAQVSINIGPEPACPYGYYDYAPYNCAPYGYYGPEWFSGGVFIGAGPWFHGARDFHGHVDNRFDPQHGYAGPHPERGEKPFNHFHGNEMRDGRGHAEGGHR